MTTAIHDPDLLASLERHDAKFTTLLSLIPARYYIAPTQEEVQPLGNSHSSR